ncbi:hypothetical protein SAMN02910456_01433 [Ruminococcaceae bacterium YRB3002]|nr:hypothetical protein SAMN02910456_01433 [Ruminococcaceae bacterium YRB3002]
MDNKTAKSFIDKYERFYFELPENENSKKTYKYAYTEKEKDDLGLNSIVNPTKEEIENHIITNKLNKGVFDEESFAWKSGKYNWAMNKLSPITTNDEKSYLNLRDQEVDIAAFKKYAKNIGSIKIDSDILKKDYETIRIEIKKYYKNAKKDVPTNMGPVYIITAMFFISKGSLPIYDSMAHRAVKALYYDIPPCDVHLGDNPSKHSINGVFNLYFDYIYLLLKVFPFMIYKTDQGVESEQFICRKLDRALWVYGHAKKKWENPESTILV